MQRGLNGGFIRMAFFFSIIVIEMYSTEMSKSFMISGFVRPENIDKIHLTFILRAVVSNMN